MSWRRLTELNSLRGSLKKLPHLEAVSKPRMEVQWALWSFVTTIFAGMTVRGHD